MEEEKKVAEQVAAPETPVEEAPKEGRDNRRPRGERGDRRPKGDRRTSSSNVITFSPFFARRSAPLPVKYTFIILLTCSVVQ